MGMERRERRIETWQDPTRKCRLRDKRGRICDPHPTKSLSKDKVNLVQMEKLNSSADVPQKPTLNGTLNDTSLKYLNLV